MDIAFLLAARRRMFIQGGISLLAGASICGAATFAKTQHAEIFAMLFGGSIAVLGVYLLSKAAFGQPGSWLELQPPAAPVAAQLAQIRRTVPVLAILVPGLSLWTAYKLDQLELGSERSVSVWGPVALVYENFGFWPAVLVWPGLGALVLVSAIRRYRQVSRRD